MKRFLLLFLIANIFIIAKTNAQGMEDKFPVTVINATVTKKLLFYFSGDGGINNFTEKLCAELAAKNYTVICFNSRKYFWKQKTPEQFATDATEIITYYLTQYNKKDFSVVGYSFGADAAVYFAKLLPKKLQPKLFSVVLLSPSMATDFKIKFTDLLGMESNSGEYKILSELNKLILPVLSIFGEEGDKTFYNGIAVKKNLRKALLKGSHKFDNNISLVATTIITGL